MEKEKGYLNENGEYIFPIIKKYYSCYDKTAEMYLSAFEAESDMRAIRMAEEAVENKNSAIGKHPEDFKLVKLFEINMRTGEIINKEIKNIIELKEMKNE